MEYAKSRFSVLVTRVQHNFIWMVLAAYALAGFFPQAANPMRNWVIVSLPNDQPNVTLQGCLLALLLFNAGFGVRWLQLRQLHRTPGLLVGGLSANILYPILFIALLSLPLSHWHNRDEAQSLLVGMAFVAAMPIAGSSTAWMQNVGGNLALGLGLVLGSTLLSPLSTPLALQAISLLCSGDYAARLRDLAQQGATDFLDIFVVIPIVLGMATRRFFGEARADSCQPFMKLLNLASLALLLYSNAAVSLPGVLRRPDVDFLLAVLIAGIAMCFLAFATGHLIARLYRAERTQAAALMFGLGMNNNGTGLVMATMTMAQYPRVMLPLIFYNLIQHVVASWIGRRFTNHRLGAPS